MSDPGELLTKEIPVIQGPSIKLGMKHPYVALIQVALSMTVGLKSAPRGEFDHKTRAAFANFQRSLGYIGDAASGVPDVNSLRVLAKLTGVFRVVE
jgi:peptidoglycan hydrolase-like protein with peptidoglycan-binding domain